MPLATIIRRFTRCHRLLVNPGRLLKKIKRFIKQWQRYWGGGGGGGGGGMGGGLYFSH